MGYGRIFLKTSVPLFLMTTYRMSRIHLAGRRLRKTKSDGKHDEETALIILSLFENLSINLPEV